MSTNASTRFGRLTLALLAVVEFLASKMCSKHGKRVLFISSLYVQVTQLERMKVEVVNKLNTMMGLKVTREDAVHFPAAISSIVWRGTEVGNMLSRELSGNDVNEQRVKEVSAKVVDLCPRLIRYAPRPEMVRDVTDLILNVRGMAAA